MEASWSEGYGRHFHLRLYPDFGRAQSKIESSGSARQRETEAHSIHLKVPGTDVQVWTSNYLSMEQHQRRSSRHPKVLSHVDGGSRN